MTAYCSKCGNGLPPAARFCSTCGTIVSGMPPGSFGTPPYGQPYGQQPYGQPPYGQPFAPPYASRLLRPIHGRQVAGVCAAFARNYGWDIGLLRILMVVAGVFIFPIPEIVYICCWVGIPEEQMSPLPPSPPTQPPSQV